MSSTFSKMENTIFTISDNMIYMAGRNVLAKVVSEEISKRNLSIRDFAKLVGVSHPTISDLLSGESPSYDTCVKLAPILHLPLESVMRAGNLLPEAPEATEYSEELLHLAGQLPEGQRRQLLEYARFLLGQVEQSRGKKK